MAMKKEWFANPRYDAEHPERDERLVRQTPERPEEAVTYGAPLTVSADGRVEGHAALWGRCHVGIGNTCIRPPREDDAYRGFLTGQAVEGIPTGPIMLGGPHAPLTANAADAQDFYAATSAAVADVTVGTDAFGIWAAGAVRASASEAQVEALRASALSGDWRLLGGSLRLVALLAVNTPGFRVHRAHALAASGALITIGPRCGICEGPSPEDELASLRSRLDRLEMQFLTAGITAP